MPSKKKKNVKKEDIKKSAQFTDKFLEEKQKKHVKAIEKSIKKLQDSILNDISILKINRDGRVEGIKVNLKQSQKIHRKIEQLFYDEFSQKTKRIIDDFQSIEKAIEKSYSYLNESVDFVGIDKKAMDVLKDGYWQEYLSVGGVQKNKVVQAVYNHVIAGESFSSLVASIESSLVGNVSVTGRPLMQYARTYANDQIMNFHSEVSLKKGEEIGMKYFLYVGNIIQTTRDFCKRRVGRAYTKKQIQSWKYKWKGKSGPAWTHRGGYNCRHHWQPIRKEWMEGKKKMEVQDWFKQK